MIIFSRHVRGGVLGHGVRGEGPFRYQNVCNFTPRCAFPNASDACPNDIHGLPVGGCDVRNSSNSFALRWRVFSSEVAKLKLFCFDLALK